MTCSPLIWLTAVTSLITLDALVYAGLLGPRLAALVTGTH